MNIIFTVYVRHSFVLTQIFDTCEEFILCTKMC